MNPEILLLIVCFHFLVLIKTDDIEINYTKDEGSEESEEFMALSW